MVDAPAIYYSFHPWFSGISEHGIKYSQQTSLTLKDRDTKSLPGRKHLLQKCKRFSIFFFCKAVQCIFNPNTTASTHTKKKKNEKREEREKIKLLIFQSSVPSNNTVTQAIELLTWSREQRGKRPFAFYTALMLKLTKQVYASRENIAPTVLYCTNKWRVCVHANLDLMLSMCTQHHLSFNLLYWFLHP